jgi:hypothetical protein
MIGKKTTSFVWSSFEGEKKSICTVDGCNREYIYNTSTKNIFFSFEEKQYFPERFASHIKKSKLFLSNLNFICGKTFRVV